MPKDQKGRSEDQLRKKQEHGHRKTSRGRKTERERNKSKENKHTKEGNSRRNTDQCPQQHAELHQEKKEKDHRSKGAKEERSRQKTKVKRQPAETSL